MYIKLCCINKQLPRLFRHVPKGTFQSAGDWNIVKLMDAVTCMVASQCTAVFVLTELTEYALGRIAFYLHRGWYKDVIIMTSSDQEKLVRSQLHEWIADGHVTYMVSKQPIHPGCELYAFMGEPYAVTIQGPISCVADLTATTRYYSRYSYSIEPMKAVIEHFTITKPDCYCFKSALETVVSRARLSRAALVGHSDSMQHFLNLPIWSIHELWETAEE